MRGKRGLVMGVANDHSIAWGIAKALAAHGAELAFTYQGDALGKRVAPLAESLGSKLVLPCDVEDIELGRRGVRRSMRANGERSISSSMHRLFRQERAEGPLRRHDPREFRAHDDDLGLLLHRDRQARRAADAERAARC